MTTENKNTLAMIDGETLMDMRLPTTKFCADTLLPQGVSINGQWLLEISFSSAGDGSAISDGETTVCLSCVPSVPCVPASAP